MTKYFLDYRDAQGMVLDEEGADFQHLEDALDEAKATARDLVKQLVDDRTPLTATCIEVRDTSGNIVATVTLAEVLEHPLHPEFKSDCADIPRVGHR